jgi:hypothetical protein
MWPCHFLLAGIHYISEGDAIDHHLQRHQESECGAIRVYYRHHVARLASCTRGKYNVMVCEKGKEKDYTSGPSVELYVPSS